MQRFSDNDLLELELEYKNDPVVTELIRVFRQDYLYALNKLKGDKVAYVNRIFEAFCKVEDIKNLTDSDKSLIEKLRGRLCSYVSGYQDCIR